MNLKIILSIPLLLLCLFLSAQHTTRCEIQVLDRPTEIENQAKLEIQTQNWIKENKAQATARAVYTIPVVVHIVYHDPIENISDQQVYDQLAVLNEDYRFLNADTDRIPDEFKAVAADVGIEFCLVNVDPEGQPSTGITRTNTEFECIGNTVNTLAPDNKPRLFYTDKGGKDIWDSEKYLNLYVANACDRYLGRAKLPGTVSPNEDAPVIDFDHFGNNCSDAARPFHLGRTATHEVGHYFNLRHVFGDATGCDEDDFVEDTPLQDTAYLGCPTYPKFSCNSSDLFMNFMDFSYDQCMKLFTIGQKERILATLLDEAGPRKGLLGNNLCAAPPVPPSKDVLTVFPNPAGACIHIDFKTTHKGKVQVRLFNALGQLIYSRENNDFALKSIETNNIADGIYWLVISYDDVVLSRKVLKKS